jgi:hypothetical protein
VVITLPVCQDMGHSLTVFLHPKIVANMRLLVLTAQSRPQAHPTLLKEADCMLTDREAIYACTYGLTLSAACTVIELFPNRNRCSYSGIGSADKNGSDPDLTTLRCTAVGLCYDFCF